MNYLFFDIECANCFEGKGKICEFGYVFTDENFNPLEQDNFIINPQAPFDKYALENILQLTETEYNSHPNYLEFFEKIKNILSKLDTLIFGVAIRNDAKYLYHESVRFNLDKIDFKFYDIQIIFKEIKKLDHSLGLEKMVESLSLPEEQKYHNALTDAVYSYKVLESLCKETGASVLDLIKKIPECAGEIKDGKLIGGKPKNPYLKKYKKATVSLGEILRAKQEKKD